MFDWALSAFFAFAFWFVVFGIKDLSTSYLTLLASTIFAVVALRESAAPPWIWATIAFVITLSAIRIAVKHRSTRKACDFNEEGDTHHYLNHQYDA